MRMRGNSCSRRHDRMSTACSAFHQRWPSSSAPVAVVAKARWRRLTEIYHFLRLLYVKLGTQYCPRCDIPIAPQSFDTIVARLMSDYRGQRIGLLAPLVIARKGIYTDLAKWAKNKGFTHLRVDGQFLPTGKFPRLDRYMEHNIELPVADVVIEPANEAELRAQLQLALDYGKGVVLAAAGLEKPRSRPSTSGDAPGASAPLSYPGVLDPSRVPQLRHQLCRVGSSAVFVQLETRLVQRLLRHWPETRRL